ncbi:MULTISPECIES: PilZ domain-containing protein [Rhodanobacter]|uniref:PilZ domain-containing protein n=1 Tax=Rhodanobacter hydrolyticus TaxID=2250595 RepID=A0ABW8JA28_9GAMM|nr:PilZ domain-containing protein [Rhodanobacter sp. 7MK24]MBD8881081.1 PilZ domain-containing protein [Rhodanobacter sp. 7MK24]
MSTRDQRRAPRKPVDAGIVAIDMIAEQPLGNLCNVSASGLLLIGSREPRSEGIYQVRIALPHAGGHVELGLQEQWHEPAASPGQFWAGYRIIAVGNSHSELLGRWLKQA